MEHMSDKRTTCKVCGAPLPPSRRVYCSDACAKAEARAARRVKVKKERPQSSVYTERACQDCGKVIMMHIKSKRCPECQREAVRRQDREHARKRNCGQARKIGSVDLCQNCGQPYVVNSGLQRYCKSCATWIWKENDREASRQAATEKLSDAGYRNARNAKRRNVKFAVEIRTCPACGKEFKPPYPNSRACSPECSKIIRARKNKEYCDANVERLTAIRKQRIIKNKKER